ncbi:MAG: hypothetical protein ABS52_15820 [Gemmatimonadetes bacterium SCN 70-22]|nr:MAG: hypothetical protein ABS52_15820 [Gemmatimonadetes bacterium SCN 70-22]
MIVCQCNVITARHIKEAVGRLMELDEFRVVTPGGAVGAGARYLVLGRAVTAAGDPRGAMERVRREMAGG